MAQQRRNNTQEEKDAFDEKVLRMKERGLSDSQIAEELGVNPKTVQRSRARSRSENRLLKKEIPQSQQMRDELFEEHMDTFQVIRGAIRRTERIQDALEREMGFGGEEPCECCGRFPLKTSDPLKWQAAFKGGEAINAQVTTLMKALGQLSDNTLIVISQIDEDIMVTLEEIAQVDKQLARQIFNRLIERSQRRRQRLPEFGDIVEGSYKALPSPVSTPESAPEGTA